MSSRLEPYQTQLIEQSMSVGALRFGSFTHKSGRVSPYFFNAGLISTGPLLYTLASAYAHTIIQSLSSPSSPLPPFDVLFGPAYKGISLAACTTLLLHQEHGIEVGFACARKEKKQYAEGGYMVGVSIEGKKVLILDDVMTSGSTVRGAFDTIVRQGGEVVGVVLILDREEVGQEGRNIVQEIEDLVGGPGRVKAVLEMRDLMLWLDEAGETASLARMQEYRDQYRIKE